jgi:hypothetical protein
VGARGRHHFSYATAFSCGPLKFREFFSLLKNSLAVRFHPRSGTKQAGLGAFRARFVVAISSMATFSTGCLFPRTL